MDHNSKEEIPQFLKGLKSQDAGYRVPKDYFAKMQDNVLSQVVEQKTAQQIELLDNIKKWYQVFLKPQYAFVGIAAMILIGVFVGNTNNAAGTSDSFANIEESDLDYFMENNIDDINHQELMATLSEDEIDFNDFSIPISNDALNTIPDDYIEDLDNTTLIDFELED